MLAIPTSEQIRSADKFTIEHGAISSYDLMEKAATAFADVFQRDFPKLDTRIAVVCGSGNNGGDGLAVARLLHQRYYTRIKVFLTAFDQNYSEDNLKNQQALQRIGLHPVLINTIDDFNPGDVEVIIDALLGSGLSRELDGDLLEIVRNINQANAKVYALDVPSGFFGEGAMAKDYKGIVAEKTISFHRPKINFLFPESQAATKDFELVDIGLDEGFLRELSSDFIFYEAEDVRNALGVRHKFANKGTFGHACIVGGSAYMMGAALLAIGGALGVGAGKVSAAIPETGLPSMNTSYPEAMFVPRAELYSIDVLNRFDALAVGCGLGQSQDVEQFLEILLRSGKPMVVDADGLNILAHRKDFMDGLAPGSILTPHVKEFDRLFGQFENWWDRVAKARQIAQERQWTILLKNRYTFICHSDGKVYVNATGHPAMAQGGMGDVLCGMIAGFLAQGLDALCAAAVACYIHGLAGETLAEKRVVVAPSLLIKALPEFLFKSVDLRG